ncbi:MAG: hypothetical protein AAGA99_08900 [Actinomycetota bacterium]
MTEEAATEPADRTLLLDDLEERLGAFQLLRKSDPAAADEVLSDIGAAGKVERQIVLELGAMRPLGHPDRFPEAHRIFMRSLEVLDRNGARAPEVRGVPGPLRPIAQYLVGLVARFIVRNYQSSVVDNVRNLYTRREAATRPDDPARRMLSRARIHAERVSPGYKRNPLGVPTFLLGGAVLSGLIGAVQNAAGIAIATNWARVVATVVIFGLFFVGSWVVLRGAAVARRRIRLTMVQPLEALYETIGRCGDPPKDQSRQFAVISVVLTGVAWFVLPIGAAASFLG